MSPLEVVLLYLFLGGCDVVVHLWAPQICYLCGVKVVERARLLTEKDTVGSDILKRFAGRALPDE